MLKTGNYAKTVQFDSVGSHWAVRALLRPTACPSRPTCHMPMPIDCFDGGSLLYAAPTLLWYLWSMLGAQRWGERA